MVVKPEELPKIINQLQTILADLQAFVPMADRRPTEYGVYIIVAKWWIDGAMLKPARLFFMRRWVTMLGGEDGFEPVNESNIYGEQITHWYGPLIMPEDKDADKS